MRKFRGWAIAAGLVLLGSLSAVPMALGDEPMTVIRNSTDQVIQILKDPALKDNQELKDKKLWETISTQFDFEEMARRSLGFHWRERSPQEQKEFVDLFSHLLHKSYVGKLAQYTDEKVAYLGQEVSGPRAEVKTKLMGKAMELPIEYRLMQKSSSWVIYDVVIEGVSLVNNYRNQFNRIVVSSGYKELVKRMRTKWDELIKETEKPKKGST
jgi:phospholipid transport system substrate-binding protein